MAKEYASFKRLILDRRGFAVYCCLLWRSNIPGKATAEQSDCGFIQGGEKKEKGFAEAKPFLLSKSFKYTVLIYITY